MKERLCRKRRGFGGVPMSKKPSCVKADSDVAFFISSLKEGSHLLKIINHGLDVLK